MPGVSSGEPYHPEWDFDKAVTEGVRTCGVVSTAINMIAEKAATVPWYKWEITGEGGGEKVELYEPIEYPSRSGEITRDRLMETAHWHSTGDGNALFKVSWKGGRYNAFSRQEPIELYNVDPYGVQPVPDKTRKRLISHYQFDDNNSSPKTWDAREIVHVQARIHPRSPYWGLSVLEPYALQIDAMTQAQRLSLRRFLTGARPATIISDPDIDTPEKRQEAQDNMNRSATEIFGGFLVLGGKQVVHPQSHVTEDELGLLASLAFYRNDIAAGIGLLPSIFSESAMTYENLNTSLRHVWQAASLWNARFAAAFTARFLPREERGKFYIAPDYSGVDALQQDSTKVDSFTKLVTSGVAVNAAIDYTALPIPHQIGGDEPLVSNKLTPASRLFVIPEPSDQEVEDPEEEPEDDDETNE
jgi:phage portal protein BeeE